MYILARWTKFKDLVRITPESHKLPYENMEWRRNITVYSIVHDCDFTRMLLSTSRRFTDIELS